MLGRSTAALMLANLGAALSGVVTGVVAARTLGAEGRGDLAVLVYWPSLVATLVDFGIADAVTLRCARDPGSARGLHRNGLRLALIAGSLGAGAGVSSIHLLLRSDQYFLLADAMWAFAYVPLSAMAAVPVGTLLGLQSYRSVAAIRIGTAALYTVSMLVAVAMGFGTVRVLLWLTVASRGIPLLLSAPILHSHAKMRAPQAARPDIEGQALDGARLHSARLAAVVAASEDRAIASLALGREEIGYWQVASALTVVLQFVSVAVAQHLYASVPTSGSEGGASVRRAYVRAVALTGAVVAVSAPFLPCVVPLVYGEEFRASVPAGVVVMFAAVAAAGVSVLQAGAKAALRTRICVLSEVAGIGVMALVAWPATHFQGGLGLGVAYLAGRLAAGAVMAGAARGLFAIPPRELLPLSGRFIEEVRLGWRELRHPALRRVPKVTE